MQETDCVRLCCCDLQVKRYPAEFLSKIFLFVPEQLSRPFCGTKTVLLILNDQTYNIAGLCQDKEECLADIDHSGDKKTSEEN